MAEVVASTVDDTIDDNVVFVPIVLFRKEHPAIDIGLRGAGVL